MYRMVLASAAGVPRGEVFNFDDFNWFSGLSKVATVSFSLPLSTPWMDYFRACDGIVKVYRKNQVVFAGPIVASQVSVDREKQRIMVNCADYSWYFTKRLYGKTTTGHLWSTATNRADIIDTALTDLNTEGWTGVLMAAGRSSGSAITYKAQYTSLMQMLQDLGNALDGFDWQVMPLENYNNGVVTLSGGNPLWGYLHVNTVRGTAKPTAVFEYGPETRSNVLSFEMNTTREGQATRVYHLGKDVSDVKTGTNATAESYWGLLMDVVQGDFSDNAMRQSLVDEHATVRGNPRTLVKITPHIDPGDTGRVPEPWVDYFPGDTITARLAPNGTVMFSGALRVYATKITFDGGFERTELILEDDA